MGNVRTDQIKRTAKEIIKRFPDKFTNDFDANKQTVERLLTGVTTKVRNQIAGYITHFVAGEYTEQPIDEEEHDTEEGDQT